MGLVVEDAETSHSRICVCISTVLAALISPVLWDYDFIDGPENVHLQLSIALGGCCETGRGVYFDKPRLAVIVDEDIETVKLEAMLVVDYDTLDALEGHNDDIVDILEAPICLLCPVDHLQVKFQVLSGPFAAMIATVLLAVLLNGHVGEMHEHVVHLSNV